MIRNLHAAAVRLLVMVTCLLVAAAVAVLTLKFPAFAAVFVCFRLWRRLRHWSGPQSSHGSAHFARLDELYRAGLLADDGFIYGTAELVDPPPRRWALRALFSPWVGHRIAVELFLAALFPSRYRCERLIRLRSPVHTLTCAKTGRGKSTRVFIVQLLSCFWSMVVVDPKCELWDKTAEHRAGKFRHRCFRVDPFGLGGTGGHSLNPVFFLDPTAPDFLDACRDLASAIVVREPGEKEPHWNDSAELVITAFVAYVAACETDPAARNLVTVRQLLASRHRYTQATERMQQVEGFDGVIAKLGHLLTWFQGDELASVLTHVQRHTAFLDSPDVAACVATTSFHPRELRSGRVTVYLCLPPTRLRSLAGLQRLWLSTILRVLAEGTPSEKNPVQFLIDEAAHIGRVPVLEDAVTLMRGAGIRLWFAFQSLAQIKDCYGERAEAFLDNIDTQQYFGVGHETAEALSKRLGDATILIESLNDTTSTSRPEGGAATTQGGQVSNSRSLTVSAHGRALARADELTQLDDSTGILLHRNLPPIPLRTINYFEFDGFKHGGTGAARGVGPRAIIAAAAALVLIALGTFQVLRLPVTQSLPSPATRPAGFVPGTTPYGIRPAPVYPGHSPLLGPPARRRPPMAVPVRRGGLIRVR